MSTPVNLPALGESVTEGTVTRWLKQVGDTVSVDEPLLEVSTDKVDTEIPSPVAGTILEINAAEDETVEVGAQLCVIGDEGEGGSPSPESDSSESEEPEESESADESGSATAGEDEAQQAAEEAGDDGAPEAESQSAESSEPSEASSEGDGGGSSTPVTLPALGESVTELSLIHI